ncbi:hypothetical protein EK21DRAFT_79550 [Setomelanomma holmii]|uniref:Zn(2)-C6 fungal-type domain-containing protein n=1 Tax=Setomelanomma holmii TaxID=210430 RepID=A0A9P4LGB9_9PLEO|nr:hypothetical protein EK21DRAFT_79550 [Setomelanomma holmii]
MVYRGRPSTGCKKCRERKIKCDEHPGGCVKCGERGFTCPGYDRNVDAFFHDETANVEAKAKKSKAKAIAARNQRDAMEMVKTQEPPMLHLIAPLVDQGVNYFLTHFSSGIDQPPVTSRIYHQHLATNGFHPLVATTMTALGIAGVGNLYMDSQLKREATRWYLKAIRMANAAISSPEEVRNDTTLVAVNLLSMFEATFNDKSLAGWSNHVDGASLLVKLRGMSQFSTPAGRRMYLHTIGLLTMNCMGQCLPMPEYVRELNAELTQYLNIEDPRNAFFFLHIKTADLRAQIINQPSIDLENIVESALELDRIALFIFDGTNEDWCYDVVPCPGRIRGVFGDSYHVYPTHGTAQTWNWVRYNRIYFHDIIRNSILAGLATSPPILAFFQNFQKDSMPLADVFVENGSVQDRLPIVRISGGYSTLWALYVAGSMPTASPASQDFVLDCFGRIERDFGVNQAKVLATALRRKREMINGGETAFDICPQYLPPDDGPSVPFQGTDSKVGVLGPEVLMDATIQAGFPSIKLVQPTR